MELRRKKTSCSSYWIDPANDQGDEEALCQSTNKSRRKFWHCSFTWIHKETNTNVLHADRGIIEIISKYQNVPTYFNSNAFHVEITRSFSIRQSSCREEKKMKLYVICQVVNGTCAACWGWRLDAVEKMRTLLSHKRRDCWQIHSAVAHRIICPIRDFQFERQKMILHFKSHIVFIVLTIDKSLVDLCVFCVTLHLAFVEFQCESLPSNRD